MTEFPKRKVFISWSKSPTNEVATALAALLTHMFDNVVPFVSADDIEAGTPSIAEIHAQLAGTSFGILIVSQRNQTEPWLNFEAGSLAKTIPDDVDARVVPLLIDFSSTAQLQGPIANLQAVLATEDGVKRLMSQLGTALKVDPAVVSSRWQAGWDRFSTALEQARSEMASGGEDAPPERSVEDMLAELLQLSRGQRRRGGFSHPLAEPSEVHFSSPGDALWTVLSNGGVPPIEMSFELGGNGGSNRVSLRYPSKLSGSQLKRIRRLLDEYRLESSNHNTVISVSDAVQAFEF